ncbi:hypothetical protein [Ferrovibrio sp.]|uniref:hypothetical protein n=1 Tax=Ferrovibrio sp. TaxID=1917215 RepID=UPI0035186FBC
MALTRSFHTFVVRRAKTDMAFRREILREAVDAILGGEAEVGSRILANYRSATKVDAELAQELECPATDVGLLFDPKSNDEGFLLIAAISRLLEREGMTLATRRKLAGPSRSVRHS